jgi:hypothetical protein
MAVLSTYFGREKKYVDKLGDINTDKMRLKPFLPSSDDISVHLRIIYDSWDSQSLILDTKKWDYIFH